MVYRQRFVKNGASGLNIEDLRKAPAFDRWGNLEVSLNAAGSGLYLEFGVYKGKSINRIAQRIEPGPVYGFDSFRGLPERWDRGRDAYEAGHFDVGGLIPNVWPNAKLIPGFFEESLPGWLEQNGAEIAFVHIDCDLYSSAKYVLTQIDPFIVPGTVILFDEICDWRDEGIYQLWEEGEWQALNEWLEEFDREVVPICRGERLEGTVKVTR